jgi:uncharacterized protein DUF3108
MNLRVAAVLIAAVLLPGCATVVEGTSQSIAVNTEPAGAACRFTRNGQVLGSITDTPGSLIVRKKNDDIDVTCEKPGYQNATAHLRADLAVATFGNVLIGGIVGVILDASTGANFKYDGTVRLVMVTADRSKGPDAAAPPAASARSLPSEPKPSAMLAATEAARPTAEGRQPMMFGDAVDFRCPSPHTEIGFRSGVQRVFAGADGITCRYEASSGAVPITAFGTDAAAAATLQQLWPLSVGKEVSFSATTTNAGSSAAAQETYRVVGHEIITVPAGSFDCFIIEREAMITAYRDRSFEHSRYWYAPEVGYVVKVVKEIRGRSDPQVSDDEAVRIVWQQ